MIGRPARIATFVAVSVGALAATTTHAHASTRVVLPLPACGVSAWGVTGGSSSSPGRKVEGSWDGGTDAPRPGEIAGRDDAPLAPRDPAAEATPFLLLGGGAVTLGSTWTALEVASQGAGDDGLDPLLVSVPVIVVGVALVAVGVARWADADEADDGAPPLRASSRGIGATF